MDLCVYMMMSFFFLVLIKIKCVEKLLFNVERMKRIEKKNNSFRSLGDILKLNEPFFILLSSTSMNIA